MLSSLQEFVLSSFCRQLLIGFWILCFFFLSQPYKFDKLFAFLWTSTLSRSIKRKTEVSQYPAILTSRLVNSAYLTILLLQVTRITLIYKINRSQDRKQAKMYFSQIQSHLSVLSLKSLSNHLCINDTGLYFTTISRNAPHNEIDSSSPVVG